jgi:hypothetical protein
VKGKEKRNKEKEKRKRLPPHLGPLPRGERKIFPLPWGRRIRGEGVSRQLLLIFAKG